jgi:hypothetical protein
VLRRLVIKLDKNKKTCISLLILIYLFSFVSGLQRIAAGTALNQENESTAQNTSQTANSMSIKSDQPITEAFPANPTAVFQGGGKGEQQALQFSSASDNANFTQHLMCKDQKNYNPIDPTTIFSPSDAKAVCLAIVLIKAHESVDFRWYHRDDSSKAWISCWNWSYSDPYNIEGEHVIAGYINISGCWPGVNYPRAYKVEVYHMNTTLLFSEFFEVTNGGLNSPRMYKDIDANENPVNMTSRFTIGVDTKAYYYLGFDKIAYFNDETGFSHNFTTVWIQPDGSTYKTFSGSFEDYKDENTSWNYWEYGYAGDDYISIDSGTPVGNWKVEVYLDSYFNNTWMPYGPIAITPFVVGNESVADWTFMAYLDGDNTLENASIDIFLKMANVTSSSRVNVIAQLDRIPGQDSRYGNWSDCKRFDITEGMTLTPENAVQNLSEVNMGDPNTLKDFVNWTMNNYPANHYCLVLMDHGTGCMGICFDSSATPSTDFLNLTELSRALSGLPSIVDLALMDACSMSMAEVAYQIKDYANILVAPEGLGYEPAPYDDYITNLVSNSSMSPDQFAKDIVTDYIDWCWTIDVRQISNATMSAIDLTKITSLTAAIDDFAINLKEKETPYHEQISLARALTEGYEGPYSSQFGYYVDLYHFAQLIYQNVPDVELRNVANQVMTALSVGNAIIIEDDKADLNAHGLSIFFPDEIGKYNYDSFKNLYESTAFAIGTPWDEFVKYHLSGYLLTIQTPYSEIQVEVNGDLYLTDADGKVKVFGLPGSYSVNVPRIVPIELYSRGNFTKWNDSVKTNTRTVSLNGDLTLEAEYVMQYQLIMNTNFGTITASSSVGNWTITGSTIRIWNITGSRLLISASAPSTIDGEQYVWLQWTGIGIGSYTGTGTDQKGSASITVNDLINETAAWRHEYYLTVASLHESPTPTSEWFEVGTSINASVTSPASGSTGTRYLCTGWTGTGSVPSSGTSTAVTFTIGAPSNISWNWKTQYYLKVLTNPAGISPQPDISPQGPWYDMGTVVNCTAKEINGYAFDHWTCEEASWESGIKIINVNMTGPCEATAYYVHALSWWDTLFNSQNLQVILGALGTVLTVGLLGTAWIRTRKRRSITKTFLDEIDDVYSKFKTNPQMCEEELYRLRNTILEGLTDGKITEENYAILDRKIDKYMKELEDKRHTSAND